MKVYKTQSEVEKDIKNGLLEIQGDVKFECSISISASIKVIAGTSTLGTSTLGTSTLGTSTLGTSTLGTSPLGTSPLGTFLIMLFAVLINQSNAPV